MEKGLTEDLSDSTQLSDSDNDQRLYFVPYRWWKDAQNSTTSSESNGKRGVLYTGTSGSSYVGPMKLINNIFSSGLVLNLKKEEESLWNGESDEAGVSGRDFALVLGEMWLKALKWHTIAKVALKCGKTFSAAADDMRDVYPLQLRLSVQREVNSLGVKISKKNCIFSKEDQFQHVNERTKDNAIELFRRACKISSVDSETLRIWDFSGQTTLFFINDSNKFPKNCQRQSDQEILLELQVYGLLDKGKEDDAGTHSSGNSLLMNGSASNISTNVFRSNSSSFLRKFGEAGSLGLTGLHNLGNTCFMNSSIQCLAHTPKLVDYFLGDYVREINHDNPLGMNGEIALAFGDLLRKLWAPGATPVAPRMFKSKLARFAPQFSGFNQHDSQELLAFLLDGLHEDLNRVKSKPYIEAKDGDGRPDEEIADEYWRNHVPRNDSIIVDVCQGQYKSTLVCPVCKKAVHHGKPNSSWKAFGIPLVGPVCDIVNGSDICNLYLTLPTPFQVPADDTLSSCNASKSTAIPQVTESEDNSSSTLEGNSNSSSRERANSVSDSELEFYLTDEKGSIKESKIVMNEPVTLTGAPKQLNVLVCWPEKQIKQYDTHVLSSLPEIFKSGFLAKKPQESVSLYKCLEAFLKEEPLGPDDMWFCPGCKKHRQAS